MRRFLIPFLSLALMAVSCGPSRHAIHLEMRYPSKSGLDLAGKVLSVVYLENDNEQGNLFNESMADAFAYNLERDYGTGEGGSLFDFVCKFANISRGEVYDWLASFRNMVPESEYREVITPILQRPTHSSKIVIDSASHNFTRYKLVEYATSRAISKEILEKYCEEVIYHVDSVPDKQYYAIGFKNNSGGYVRSKNK